MPTCYVAGPYARAPYVREVHALLAAAGVGASSRWAEAARGAEPFLGEAVLADIARANDRDVVRADAMLVLAYEGEGGEQFCEMRYALDRGKPVFYVGARRILSAYRRGVCRCASVEEAIGMIARTLGAGAA